MIRNYILVALRNFLRQRFYSWINVVGLTSGIACALLILLWVYNELSVNQFHKDIDRIVKVHANYSTESGVIHWSHTPGPLAQYVRENVTGVQYAARTYSAKAQLIQYETTSLIQSGYYADADLFQIFSFDLLEGTLPDNREDKTSLLISEKLSHTLFGEQSAIGKQVSLGDQKALMVIGVFKDCPASSSLNFDFILPLQIYKENRGDGFNWGNFDGSLFLKLNNVDEVHFVSKAINEHWEALMKAENEKVEIEYYLQPFSDVHLYGTFENGLPVGGKIDYIRVFILAAIFIVVMACVNFMNMATARAMKRSKEIGIRKVVGAQRFSLIAQFIGEAILTCALAAAIAIALVYLALPLFNRLIGQEIQLAFFTPFFLLALFCLVIVTGVLAGAYPAFVLSSFKPSAVLKGTTLGSLQGAGLRRVLVVFQFSLTVVLIISAIVSSQQIKFILNKNIGYDRYSVLSFRLTGAISKQFDPFKLEVAKVNGVVDVARSNETLVDVTNHTSSVSWTGKVEDTKQLFRVILTDYNFPRTMKLQVVSGRTFHDAQSDVNNFIITETAAEIMGLSNPIGENISVWDQPGKIVAVIKDFHSGSLRGKIEPAVLYCKPEWTDQVYVRFDSTKTEQVIAALQNTFKKYSPEYPFDYKLMDDDFENQYKSEKVTQSLAAGFTAIAIILSGLGLLGLVAYTTERKQKEIGIRKALGATVPGLVKSLSSEFVKLSVIAVLLGCPVAYYIMFKFLDGYAYHISMGWEIFFLTGLVTLSLTLVIVIYQVVKAANVNPVEVLRSE